MVSGLEAKRAFGAERTTSINLQTFEIYAGDELDIPVDFPAKTFR